jgi:hypothetical protein
MIGPHEGKELELMLQGRKPLALFMGLPEEENREDIFPEQKFLPYVENGTFKRISEHILVKKDGSTIRLVFFSPPEGEWRARTIIWVKHQILGAFRKFEQHDDVLIGRLLGYSEEDIEHFLHHQASTLKLYLHSQSTDSL